MPSHSVTAYYTHILACFAYLVFAGLLAARSERSGHARFLLGAVVMTALWAGAVAAGFWVNLPWLPKLAETVRDASWYAVVLVLLQSAAPSRYALVGLMLSCAAILLLDAGFALALLPSIPAFGLTISGTVTRIASAILGLILVENLLRNSDRDSSWSLKFLGIGLFGIFAFELALRLLELFGREVDSDVLATRPIIVLIALPLFVLAAVRNPKLQLRVHTSRNIVFYTTTLIGAGILLQGAAVAALYVRHYGGSAGTILAVIVGFSLAIGTVVGLASHSVRSAVRRFIDENFFSYKYDYRLEWSRFIKSISAIEAGNLEMRVIRTLADLLDSPGGALWLFREDRQEFAPASKWAFHYELPILAAADPSVVPLMEPERVYLDLTARGQRGEAERVWLERFPDTWLIVPLRYRQTAIGLIALHRPRVEHRLDWEDGNLIELISLQLGAYLVQEEMARNLAAARQLSEFNKRFAFIIHDVKNVAGQLGLLVQNAEAFADNEEFQRDLILTVRNAVDKLRLLLSQLSNRDSPPAEPAPLPPGRCDLVPVLEAFVEEKRRLKIDISLGAEPGPLVSALHDVASFRSVLDHLFDNAIEAAGPEKPIRLHAARVNGKIRVGIQDFGPGMSAEFIRNQLFKPLNSTKGSGFGIGTYQAQETMRQLGGSIDVDSTPGQGTTMTLILPPAQISEAQVPQ
ncbi:MAG TPA: XrtA/PEP-CTERM system histidine kinase PrsK [Aliidongia sp.]|nr:XrtA/PEP-CTERM system histidine kinase PrsK [Aliidongia sp.]